MTDKTLTSSHTLMLPTHQERANRILDAAATLLVRWGYRRVTINDIAEHAGIGTGTVYLHWKSKESLFETVLLRELITLWRNLAQRLRADPGEAILHRYLSNLLLAIKQRPLARALFTRDVAVLGKLTQGHLATRSQPLASASDFITLLRELGLMRVDMPLEAQSYAFSAIWAGFVLVDQFLAGDDQVALETQHQALAQTIRHTFEPEALPNSERLRDEIAPALLASLEQTLAYFDQQVQARLLGSTSTTGEIP